jgi:hypothetical protein
MTKQPESLSELTLDEIVAKNLGELIGTEDGKLPVTAVAERLGTSRAHIYDMLGPREGRPQREFRWHEIVKLAGVLGVLVFDLVLPPRDVVLNAGRWLTRFPDKELWDLPDEIVGDIQVGALTRNEMALALFGLPRTDPEALEKLRTDLDRTKEERARAAQKEIDSLRRGIEELQEQARKIIEEME